MRPQGLQIFPFDREVSAPAASLPVTEPVLPQSCIGDVVHTDVVIRAELKDGFLDLQLRVVAQGSSHVGAEGQFEGSGKVVGNGLLSFFRQVVAEQGVYLQHSVLGNTKALCPSALEEGNSDEVVLRLERHGNIAGWNKIQVHLDQPPEEGTLVRYDYVGAVVDAQDVLPESPAHLDLYGLHVVVFTHSCKGIH